MAELKKTTESFRFYTKVHLQQLTGFKAGDLRELVHYLGIVPGGVIYHHTHRYLQQHQYLSPGLPNDFAYWTGKVLGEKALAEQLSSIDIMQFDTIRSLREKIIAIIKAHLKKHWRTREVLPGQEFYFIKDISFVLPTPYEVWTLEEFVKVLREISIQSLYFHIFEARIRLEKKKNDFSSWMERSLCENVLAEKITKLDPYTHTMEGLRESLILLVKKRVDEIKNA
ncbi:MAG: DUF5752 family protein [Candidatus Omnitrophota bacterium]